MIASNFSNARQYFYLCAIALMLMQMPGCGHSENELRIGHRGLINGEFLRLASASGFLDPSHYPLLALPSSSYVLKALNNQLIDLAVMSLPDALAVHRANPDIKILLSLSYSQGADALLVQPAIAHTRQLRGKIIGIESELLGSYLLQRVLQQQGLSVNDVTLRVVEPEDQVMAFAQGQVDAMISQEPLVSALKEVGASVFFDSRQIPDEQLFVLVANLATVCEKFQAITNLRVGWFDAMHYIRWHGDVFAEDALQRFGLSHDKAEAMMKTVRFVTRGENDKMAMPGESFQLSLGKVQPFMLQQGLLDQRVDAEALLMGQGDCG